MESVTRVLVSLSTWWFLAIISQLFVPYMRTVEAATIDEIISSASVRNSLDRYGVYHDDGRGTVIVELDIEYPVDEWLNFLRRNNSGSFRRKRGASIHNQRWTNKVIPYQFQSGQFSASDMSTIEAAMKDWARYTCLYFRPAQRTDSNKINFQNANGCSSRVGMGGGSQAVSLAPACRVKGVVIHELGHAIGLHHEQTRPDRDSYVKILTHNIQSGVEYNFQKYSWNVIQNLGVPYDYYSIMHYGQHAFSVNGQRTIETLNSAYQNVIGNRESLSFKDIKTVNIMYNCKRASSSCTKNDSDCPGEGFVGKDCNCWCPGNPYTVCAGTSSSGGSAGGGESEISSDCKDSYNGCPSWAQDGQCSSSNFVNTNCKLSCNTCSQTSGGSCQDLHSNCASWSNQNLCTGTYSAYMSANCKRSCGLC